MLIRSRHRQTEIKGTAPRERPATTVAIKKLDEIDGVAVERGLNPVPVDASTQPVASMDRWKEK